MDSCNLLPASCSAIEETALPVTTSLAPMHSPTDDRLHGLCCWDKEVIGNKARKHGSKPWLIGRLSEQRELVVRRFGNGPATEALQVWPFVHLFQDRQSTPVKQRHQQPPPHSSCSANLYGCLFHLDQRSVGFSRRHRSLSSLSGQSVTGYCLVQVADPSSSVK